jgi:hypothetical protein
MKTLHWWLVISLAAAASAQAQQKRWWMDEPIRLIQTNLRETDDALDPGRLVKQLEEFPANALLFGMGGIVAHYPTKVPFHYASPYIPAGHDTFGEVLREAHARGIRVIGRFDLSKTQKAVYDAHPEWFFRGANGQPVIYNGLYSTCHQRSLLSRARPEDPHRGAGALRGGWAVLQRVRKPDVGLQRQPCGALPLRELQEALPRTLHR